MYSWITDTVVSVFIIPNSTMYSAPLIQYAHGFGFCFGKVISFVKWIDEVAMRISEALSQGP